jgi:Big-like domain-containing protein
VPTVQIFHPTQDTSAINGQPLTVTGQATDRGGTEPALIERVTVQVDGDSPVPATLTRSHDTQHTIADFTATVIITGAQGPHTITATATNDAQMSVSESVTVFLGPVFQAHAPAILLDVDMPFSVDPNDPKVRSLLASIQQSLAPVSDVLASNGMLIAGPNLQAIPDGAITVLRLGLWVEPDGFPVLQPASDVLPVLSDAAAAASFALVPLLPRPHRTSFTDMPLAVLITATGIQQLADAALANSNNGYVSSVPVAMDPPSRVITQYNGTAYDIAFTVTVTETLTTAPIVGADPPVSAPIVATSQSNTIGTLPEIVLESLGVILLARLVQGAHGPSSRTRSQASPLRSSATCRSRSPFTTTCFRTWSRSTRSPTSPFWWRTGRRSRSHRMGSSAALTPRSRPVTRAWLAWPSTAPTPFRCQSGSSRSARCTRSN